MNEHLRLEIEKRLSCILEEVERQEHIAAYYPAGVLPFLAEMEQIREYIDVAGEYEIAYEILVVEIRTYPFVLSGKAAISLLEVGLLFGFTTRLSEDSMFDRRSR